MALGLEVQGIVKKFDNRPVLSGISFNLAEGRIGVIVGPSGIGKSTLLGIVAGVIRPDEGRVSIGGRLVDDGEHIYVRPVERSIGYVLQDYLLFPHMTVFENVSFGLRARRAPRKRVEERVAAVLALIGLERYHDMRPGEISGGQRQRVALARALVLEPELLLLDEPLSALDRPTREVMRLELRRIFESLATTVLYVTHDLDEAFFFGNDIGIMQSGRISFGSKENLMGKMTSRIAEFLGLNLLRAKFLGADQSSYKFLIDGWASSVSLPVIGNPRLAAEDSVTLAVSPGAVEISRIASPDVRLGFGVRDTWEFKDRAQIVVEGFGTRIITEVSNQDFRELNLQRGDVVRVRITEAALVTGPS